MRWMEGMDQDSEIIWILIRSNCSCELSARPEGQNEGLEDKKLVVWKAWIQRAKE